jgi:hypothetical protein
MPDTIQLWVRKCRIVTGSSECRFNNDNGEPERDHGERRLGNIKYCEEGPNLVEISFLGERENLSDVGFMYIG